MLHKDLLDCCQPSLPLLGKRILVTRPGSQGEYLANRLRALGAEPVLMPMIEIGNPDSWDQLDTSIANIDKYQWLLFASANAVISFITRLKSQTGSMTGSMTKSTTKLPSIAVIGEATAQTAKSLSLTVDYCPNNFLAEDFVAQFPGYPDNLKNTKILWPRTNYGRDFIADKLAAAGATVDVVSAYKTEIPSNAFELSVELGNLIGNKKIEAIILASKQTAINLAKIIYLNKSADPAKSGFISRNSLLLSAKQEAICAYTKDSLQGILIVTIGPETSEGALNYLGKVDKEASKHSAEGLVSALVDALSMS